MKSSLFKRVSLVILVVVYNFFFWGEGFGLNLLVFNLLSFFVLFVLYRESFKNKNVILSSLCSIILSVLIVYNNTLMTKIIFFVFFTTTVGFIHQANLKSIGASLLTGVLSLFMFLYTLIIETKELFGRASKLPVVFRKVKLIVIPVIILTIFYIIYINANPIFAKASDYVWEKADQYFFSLILDFDIVRALYVILGAAIVCGYLYNWQIGFIGRFENKFNETLYRKYNPFEKFRYAFKMNALTSEMKSATILLVMINLLLGSINAIDIQYVWFGFEYYYGFDIRQFVHDGTYLLILSILLSMGIMLFYFRGNLNFYTKNVWIKRLAYLWIMQNGIMAVSVALRNYYYIHYSHILAYKRIGLIIFLIMVCVGLVTLYMKIKNRKTIFHLIRVNFISVYLILFVSCFFNWGPIIADYNFSNPEIDRIDYEYNLNLSNETLPILDKNKELLNREIMFYENLGRHELNGIQYFNIRRDEFMKEYESRSWLSWNYADYKTYQYFKNNIN